MTHTNSSSLELKRLLELLSVKRKEKEQEIEIFEICNSLMVRNVSSIQQLLYPL